MVDEQLIFQDINPSFCNYFAESSDDIIGKTMEDIWGTSLFDKVRKYFDRALQGESVIAEIILNYPRVGLRNTRLSLTPHYNENRELINLFINIVDISEQFQLREFLQSHKDFELFIAGLSNQFLNLEVEQIDDAIVNVLREIGQMMHADRCFIFGVDKNLNHTIMAQMWIREDVYSLRDMKGTVLQEMFPWLGKMLSKKKDIIIRTLNDLPANAVEEKDYCTQTSIQSFLMIPMISQGNWLGQLGIDMIQTQRNWLPEDILRFRLSAEVIANAIVRKNKEEKIKDLQDKLEQENEFLREEIKLNHAHGDILGNSLAIKKVLSQAEHVAPTDANVLILGETGTGKELLAHAVHRLSQRSNKAMISVNCAALPATLIESELFGREKGAYTGALTQQMGRFELAHNSTIFLDEIGELPLELQSKLLRVLQYGEFERLGSPKTIKVDVRLIVATNRNLEEMVNEGKFREDLFYRLNVFPIQIPPLRERLEDVPLLVWALVRELEKKLGRKIEKISKRSMTELCRYQWPGNVRELRNIIERTMILDRSPCLEFQTGICHNKVNKNQRIQLTKLQDVECEHISSILKQTGGRIRGTNGAAEILGLKPTTLESRMVRLGIKRLI